MGTLAAIFISVSATFSLPSGWLSSVCFVESKHNHKAVHYHDGKGNSVGACQIKLATAKMLGFKGTEKELMKPEVNIYYAGAYLNHQLRRYNGSIIKAVSSYNSGSIRVDTKGRIKNYKYVQKVVYAYIEGR